MRPVGGCRCGPSSPATPGLPPLARRLQAVVAGEVWIVYGSTEVEPLAAIRAGELLAVMDGAEAGGAPGGLCVGRPVDGLQVRLLPVVEGPVRLGAAGWHAWTRAPGQVGEIAAAGPHVLGRYLDDPAADAAQKVVDGGLRGTGPVTPAGSTRRGASGSVGRTAARVERAGEVAWNLAVEARALAAVSASHAAYLDVGGVSGPRRVLLCLERAAALAAAERARLAAALAGFPWMRSAPCAASLGDARHATRTDAAALRQALGSR